MTPTKTGNDKKNKSPKTDEPQRLQKILAQAGIASRREAEQMILAGRVSINGTVVRELGTKSNPALETIAVDGKPIHGAEQKVYVAFNKPVHVMVTRYDPEDRPTVFDYLKEIPERINYVGRLDFDSEGLLLFTNDGDLLARLTHPRYEVPKTYHAKVQGRITQQTIDRIARGVDVGDFTAQPSEVKILKENPNNTWVEIILKEGKNREVRRIFETLGFNTLRLVRVSVGAISLGELPAGRWRSLSAEEVKMITESSASDPRPRRS